MKSEVTYDSTCNQYDVISLPEVSSFSDYIPPDLDIDISIKDDNGVNESMYSECGKYLLPLQKVEYARKDVHGSIDESEVYNEAWLFGKILWVIMSQEALGLKFNSEGATKDYQCCFRSMEYLPLFRRGSYFSLPVNGHI